MSEQNQIKWEDIKDQAFGDLVLSLHGRKTKLTDMVKNSCSAVLDAATTIDMWLPGHSDSVKRYLEKKPENPDDRDYMRNYNSIHDNKKKELIESENRVLKETRILKLIFEKVIENVAVTGKINIRDDTGSFTAVLSHYCNSNSQNSMEMYMLQPEAQKEIYKNTDSIKELLSPLIVAHLNGKVLDEREFNIFNNNITGITSDANKLSFTIIYSPEDEGKSLGTLHNKLKNHYSVESTKIVIHKDGNRLKVEFNDTENNLYRVVSEIASPENQLEIAETARAYSKNRGDD